MFYDSCHYVTSRSITNIQPEYMYIKIYLNLFATKNLLDLSVLASSKKLHL